jgi:hypothetical protein
MAFIEQVNSKANVKQFTTNDLPFAPQQPVINSYYAVSTAGQTSIASLGFSIDTVNNPDVFFLFVDGKKLRLGSTADYTFAAVAADGTSSSISLNQTLPAGLNIQAYKLGLKPEIQFQMDNRFTQLYANQTAGFQGFVSQTDNIIVATSSSGTPPSGQFYSSITGRASMVDLSQDLKPRFGIERSTVQAIQQVQNEFGPNGERIWSTPNDTFGQIRFVGQWVSSDDNNGPRPQSNGSNTTDFMEVTFYGTGLNLNLNTFSGFTAVYAVDGGSESSVPNLSTLNGILNGRDYATNTIVPIVSGLTLGIHTVKIRSTTAGNTLNPYGVEIINQNITPANVSVNPGTSYIAGQKLVSSSQLLQSYASPVTGTTGGRVLVYQNASGSIGTAFTATATSPSYYNSASHANEEVVRVYHWREFGAGRSDDFSTLTGSARITGFTLDDGTTTMTGTTNTVADLGGGSSQNGVFSNATNDYLTFTFVGTGVDLAYVSQATVASTYSIILDGTTIQSGITGLTQNKTLKIASGLPYGTHTVKLLCTTLSGAALQVWQWIVYQPKTPILPAGAVQLGTYNVMANYVASSTVTGDPGTGVSQGTLYKCNLREVLPTGTGWSIVQNASIRQGFFLETATSSDAFSYTFFGTGVELTGQYSSTQPTTTVQIDGSAYTGSATLSGSGGSWTPGTSTWVFGTTGGGLQISGLTLGLHTIKLTKANATDIIAMTGVHVVTPIHSVRSNLYANLQNTLTVGSNAISDDRKITPVKDALSATKAWAQAVGIISAPSVTSTTLVPLPDMSCTVKTSGGPLQISYAISFFSSVAGGSVDFGVYVDGVLVNTVSTQGAVASTNAAASTTFNVPVSAGTHKVDVYWRQYTSYTITGVGTTRNLTVRET